MRSNLNLKAFLILLVSGSLVGLGPVIAKSIAAPAISIVLYRIALPIPVLYAIKKIKGEVRTHLTYVRLWRGRLLMALIGFFFALDLAAFYISLRYTSVAAATLLANLSPIFLTTYVLIRNCGKNINFRFRQRSEDSCTALYGEVKELRDFSGASIQNSGFEKSSRKQCFNKELIWLVISLIGLVFLCGTKNTYHHSEIIGYFAALAAAVFFSFYILLINKMGKNYSSVDIMLWSSIGGTIFLLFICLFFSINLRITAFSSIINIILLAFGVQLIGQTMLTKAISIFPPAFSALGVLIDPIAAAFFSWIILNEPLSLLEMIGASLILVGIFCSYKFQKINTIIN